MAGLTKTYSGDFAGFIAGKIWNVIKEIDEEKKAEENQASKDVKDAAKKLSKEDKDSFPVRDKDLRDTVANIFLPLEVKLSKASSNVDGMSAKITAIGGSISDTQKLVINQNEILEDKLDTMLGVLVRRNDTLDKLREDKIYEQLELALEEGIDVAGFGDIEETTGNGGGDIMASLLWGIFKDIASKGSIKGRFVKGQGWRSVKTGWLRKRLFKLFRVKKLTTKALNFAARVLPPQVLGKILGATIMTPELGRKIAKEYAPGGVSPVMKHLAKTRGLELLPQQRVWSKTASKPWTHADGVAALNRVIAGETSDQALENVAKAGGKKAIKKSMKASTKKWQSRIQGSILGAFFSSPKAQKLLVQKLGKEAAEELGVKAAKGVVKGGVPLIGTAIGAIEGIARLLMGDPKGMLLSFGSAIPVAGWGFTIIDILRDIDRDAYDKHIEPNYPFPSDTDFARFFMDAVGITPDQFERGTGHVAPVNVGLSSIQEIVGATLAIGQAAGIDTKTLVSDAGLGSVKPKGTYNFDISPTGGGKTIATQTKMVEDRELPKIKKLKKEDDEEVSTEEQIKIWEKMSKTGKLPEGGSGSGGNLIASHSSLVPHGHPTVRIDASGEPGVDFTPDGAYNRAVFDGVVTEIGHQYNPNVIGGDGRMGAGYGHYIAVTGTDPATGEKFDAVYAHFPEGELNRWKIGDTVNYGDVLGLMGTSADYANPETRKHVGSGTGPHTSLDFFKPGSTAAYPQWRGLVDRIDPSFKPRSVLGPPPPLPPIDNISAVTSNQTNLVNQGSSERLIAKRKASFSSPVIMVNNNVMTATASPIIVSSGGSEFNVKDIQYARLAS